MFPQYIHLNLCFCKTENRTISCLESYLFEIHCLREDHFTAPMTILTLTWKCVRYSSVVWSLPRSRLRAPGRIILSLSFGDRQEITFLILYFILPQISIKAIRRAQPWRRREYIKKRAEINRGSSERSEALSIWDMAPDLFLESVFGCHWLLTDFSPVFHCCYFMSSIFCPHNKWYSHYMKILQMIKI